jgi:hypothetical protein
MEILKTAIDCEGSISKLAAAIGTKPNVISNWHSRGVPMGWQKLLEHKYAKQAAAPAHAGECAICSVAEQGA